MAIGKRIEAAMIAANKKPVDIARRLKITESAVSQWFAKDTGPKTIRLSELAAFLATTVDYLMREDEPRLGFAPRPAPQPTQRAQRETDGGGDIPVWSAVAAGDDEGSIILSDAPIAWVRRSDRLMGVANPFAFHIVGDSMLERFTPGDQVVVNPAMPLSAGADCVFIQTGEDGTFRGLVKRLLRANADCWRVRQFNPPRDYELSRRKWVRAYQIVETRHY